jgi:hypothetical protein
MRRQNRGVETNPLAPAIQHAWHWDGDCANAGLHLTLEQVAVSHHRLAPLLIALMGITR